MSGSVKGIVADSQCTDTIAQVMKRSMKVQMCVSSDNDLCDRFCCAGSLSVFSAMADV